MSTALSSPAFAAAPSACRGRKTTRCQLGAAAAPLRCRRNLHISGAQKAHWPLTSWSFGSSPRCLRVQCSAGDDGQTEEDDGLEGWFDEDTVVFYEGSGSKAELIFSLLMAGTLLWLPLTMQSVARFAWITYKVTDKRFSVITNSPVKKERTDIAYSQMASVVAAPGGLLGLWGDLVITTKRGDKLL
eukprot:scaffold3209_cov349-Prasinococcus_capsulatus_cf.AAC.2